MVKLEERLSQEQKDILIEKFGILKYKEIAELVGEKVRTITKFYQNRGMVLTKEQKNNIYSRRDTKYNLNHSFFNTNTTQSLYWAGFIAADGCITNNRLQIKLKYTDKEHLESFKRDIKYNGVIKKVSSVRNNKEHFGALLYIHSTQIIKDLEKLNIYPQKSLTLEIPKLNQHELDCYIKGYFDGDGSIYKKGKYTICSFYGTDNVLLRIKDRIDELVGKNSGSIFKKGNIYCYQLNPSSSIKFFNYYKKLDTPELERKWNFI